MRKLLATVALLSLALPTGAATAESHPERAHSRVIVSATLNSTLLFFDAETLTESQPPLPSRGMAPVRLKVFDAGSGPLLLAANHGIEGSLGMFDLSGDTVLEMAASPIPARPGSVGVDAANVAGVGPMAFVTNAWQALGGCDLPAGSVTGYRFVGTGPATTVVEVGTVDVTAPIPYAVAADPAGGAYVSTNCGPTLETIHVTSGDLPAMTHGATRPSDAGPDGVLFDAARERVYLTNISASTLTVYDRTTEQPLTRVPLGANARAIDISFADTAGGRALIATSNGGDDTAGLVDRDIIEACIAASQDSCPEAVVFSAPASGAPEGIAFDPVSSRLFVVGKDIGAPILTAIDVIENPDGSLSAGQTTVIPLGALGSTASQIPAIIAFDVVVQTR